MTRHTLVMASFLMETHVMGAGPTGCMVALALAYLDGQGHGLRDPGDVIFTTGRPQGEPGHLLWEFLYKPL